MYGTIMQKIILFIGLYFFSQTLEAQTQMAKIAADIKKLSGEYMSDFKNIKGALKLEDDYETVYYSRLKINGTPDSSNLIHFSKESQFWKFTVDFDEKKNTARELDTAIQSISFSFGKVKGITAGAQGAYCYVPLEKKGLSGKIRSFFIFLLNGKKNPTDESGGKFSFTLGQEDYYMNK